MKGKAHSEATKTTLEKIPRSLNDDEGMIREDRDAKKGRCEELQGVVCFAPCP